MAPSVRVSEGSLRQFCREALEAVGLAEADAEIVADVLLFAELRGISSHGVVRLPFYIQRLEAGGTDAHARPETVSEGPGFALIDAHNGMGHVACMAAVDAASRKARAVGTAYVGVRGSSHNGALSYYAMKLAEQDFAAFVFTNTTPLMTAWGGATSAIGNNPIAFAAPFQTDRPFVFDAAMSSVAAGRVRDAASRGERIPRGWIVDEKGRDTDDPADFARGALLPFGQHKGYGFALVVEILAGVLTGAGMLDQNPFWQTAVGEPLSIGHAVLAVDVGRLMEPDVFRNRLQWVAERLLSSPPAAGSGGVIIPGEIERSESERRLREGIPLDSGTMKSLAQLADMFGLERPSPDEATR
jgi:LDH2 family malate/lactate/ureidoglycolate dehydrogenase